MGRLSLKFASWIQIVVVVLCLAAGGSVQAIPPGFPDSELPSDASVEEGRSHTLYSQLNCETNPEFGGDPSLLIQWFFNGTLLPGATNCTYTIPKMSEADAGQYHVRVSDGVTVRDSREATVDYIKDLTPPELHRAHRIGEDILLTFSEPMDDYLEVIGLQIYSECGSPIVDDLVVSGMWLYQQTNMFLQTEFPAQPNLLYNVDLLAGSVRDAQGNPLADNYLEFPLRVDVVLVPLDEAYRWKWSQDGVDVSQLETPYFDPDFDSSDWQDGLAVMGFETRPENLPVPIRTQLRSEAGGGPTTTYFITRFNLGASPNRIASLRMRLMADDGAIIYLNGREALRVRMPDGPVDAGTRAIASVGDAQIEGPFDLDPSLLVFGENVLAVEVHQGGSFPNLDIAWGCQLVYNYERVRLVPPHITRQPSPSIQEAVPGDTVSYQVVAVGTPPPTYQWRHNGTNVVGATGATLTLTNVSFSQGGTYDVVVSGYGNCEPNILSDAVELTVQRNPELTWIWKDTFGYLYLFFTESGSVYIQEADVSLSGPAPLTWRTLPDGPHSSPFNVGPAVGARLFRLSTEP